MVQQVDSHHFREVALMYIVSMTNIVWKVVKFAILHHDSMGILWDLVEVLWLKFASFQCLKAQSRKSSSSPSCDHCSWCVDLPLCLVATPIAARFVLLYDHGPWQCSV